MVFSQSQSFYASLFLHICLDKPFSLSPGILTYDKVLHSKKVNVSLKVNRSVRRTKGSISSTNESTLLPVGQHYDGSKAVKPWLSSMHLKWPWKNWVPFLNFPGAWHYQKLIVFQIGMIMLWLSHLSKLLNYENLKGGYCDHLPKCRNECRNSPLFGRISII